LPLCAVWSSEQFHGSHLPSSISSSDIWLFIDGGYV
jgi:hypothetical protein